MQETGDASSIPGWERSPGEGNGNPLQYSCQEKPMDREAWQATVQRVAKSRTDVALRTITELLPLSDNMHFRVKPLNAL